MTQPGHRALPRALLNFAGSLYADRAQIEADGELGRWLCSMPLDYHLSFLFHLGQAYKAMCLFSWDPKQMMGPEQNSIKGMLLMAEMVRQGMELGLCRQLTPEQLAQVEDYWAQVDAGETPVEPAEWNPFNLEFWK